MRISDWSSDVCSSDLALQTLRDVTVVALDKTGTLTKGRPELTDLEPAAGFGSEEVLALVASVESQSEHPIAEAIVAAAAARGLDVSSPATFEAIPGYGVLATVAGREVQVGAIGRGSGGERGCQSG